MTSQLYQPGIDLSIKDLTASHDSQADKTIQQQLMAGYLRLLNLGTDFVSDGRETKYVQISNFVAMTSLLASFLYIGFSIAWANPLWFITVNSLCILSVAVLYLNKIGRINISRRLFLAAINPLLFAGALITGPETRGENFLLIAVLIPFLIFDLRNFKMITFGVVTPLIFILSYRFLEPYFIPFHLAAPQQGTLRTLGTFMEAGLTIAAVSQFIYYTRKTEMDLEVTNKQLTLHTTELKRSNADLEQFAYVISHDLKTPVRNISCFMKLLSNKNNITLDAESREFVEYAMNGAKRMERLIEDVLAYSRIGRNLSAPSPVNINELIRMIRYELQDKLQTANASLIVSKDLPILSGVHSSLMYDVFENLISNGLKFNKNPHPEIVISCDSTSEYHLFSVSDNGIGISKEYAAQVYHMFKRLHNESEYDGTGIGLAICKKIVEQYHGELWFESQVGQGTTFYLTVRK